MDDEVDDVVAKNIETAKIIIKRKAEIGERPIYFVTVYAIKCFLDIRPVKSLQRNVFVINNIGNIIKMERALKAVRID